MRLAFVLCAVMALSAAATPSSAGPFISREDRFALNFPTPPKMEVFTYISEYKSPWTAHRYTAADKGYRYTLTVVNMSTTALTPDKDQFRNVGRPGNEKRGAMAFAAANLRKTGKVTLDAYEELQVIPGLKLEIILPGGKTNIAEIHAHGDFLYIFECVSPKDEVPGYDVESSLELLDADGYVVRYKDTGSFPGDTPIQSRVPQGTDLAGPPPANAAQDAPDSSR